MDPTNDKYIEQTLLLLNYSKDPSPIQNYQSWSSSSSSEYEFGRKHELQNSNIANRDRELRRLRQERSNKEGMIEVLIVVGILAMIFIPFLVWLYYKSGVCDLTDGQQRQRRRSSQGLTSDSSEHQQQPQPISALESGKSGGTPIMTSKGERGLPKIHMPNSTMTTKTEISTPKSHKKKSHRNPPPLKARSLETGQYGQQQLQQQQHIIYAHPQIGHGRASKSLEMSL